jgi:hypothetical protein
LRGEGKRKKGRKRGKRKVDELDASYSGSDLLDLSASFMPSDVREGGRERSILDAEVGVTDTERIDGRMRVESYDERTVGRHAVVQEELERGTNSQSGELKRGKGREKRTNPQATTLTRTSFASGSARVTSCQTNFASFSVSNDRGGDRR